VPPKFHLSLLIHAHQPIGNFEDVFERCYKNCYLPFLELLARHPQIHAGLHYSGPLLKWIERNHPEYFSGLRVLVRARQAEMIGGGMYEPILAVIPDEDQREQITRLGDYIEQHFGTRPNGAWLAERVWEPQLPRALAEANVGYTLVDDFHFLAAGFEPHELFGAYIAEDRGKSVWVFPGQKALRYLVPFRTVEEGIAYLKNAATTHPGGVAVFGDDMEKFGVWPGTYKHCYEDGWLEDFFTALEENVDWLTVCSPGEYAATHAPLGRADLPTASYPEMMEWVYPTNVRQRFHALQQEFHKRPEVEAFLRGGSWRGFFRKYAEANLLHKKMLRTSARIAAVPARKTEAKPAEELANARDLLLRAQCNDAYWHGIFGGLYAPHLRTVLWRNLIRAEYLADRLTPGALVPRVELLDYDADGTKEVLHTAPEYQVLLKPNDGGTLALVDFRPADVTLVNSMQRRPEAYHTRLRDAGMPTTGGVASIHEQTKAKEPGLERYLRYDRWPRHSFRVLIFDPKRTFEEYEALQLQEDAGFAGGAYAVSRTSAHEAELEREAALAGPGGEAAGPKFSLAKRFTFGPAPDGCEIACELGLKLKEPLERPVIIALESIVNFLAPTEGDRFFDLPGERKNLRFTGETAGPVLRMEDGWQRVRIAIHAPNTLNFWIAPIETVSESEEGFERVYQGSQILARWRVSTEKVWSARLVWRIEAM